MKKKILFALPIMILGFALTACNKTSEPDPDNNPTKPPVVEEPPVVEKPQDTSYKATVVYPDGKPVTNTMVQWCTAESCKSPVSVDSNGVASTKLDDVKGGYYIHLSENKIPAGYTYNPNIYTADADSRTVTIQLLKLSSASSGDGTKTSPYQIGAGAYKVNVESRQKYPFYVFTAPEAGTYEIESMAVDKLATVIIDPVYLPFDVNFENRGTSVSTGGNGKNFKATVTATAANQQFAFGISFNSSVDLTGKDSPAEFSIEIRKQ